MLTDTRIKQAKYLEKTYKIYDAKGLYLEIPPKKTRNGSKRWRYKYQFEGTERLLSFGLYPRVSLREARSKQLRAQELLEKGIDPKTVLGKRAQTSGKEHPGQAYTFKKAADEYFNLNRTSWAPDYAQTVRYRLDKYILPALGKRALADISSTELLELLRKIEARGTLETANRVLGICSRVFHLSIRSGKCSNDPCQFLNEALAPKKERHFAALTTEAGARALMRSIESYKGSFVVRCALRFTALTFVRQGELRFAPWSEIDWDEKIWRIPPERMKARKAHLVPLSRQSLDVLNSLRAVNGDKPYIFNGSRKARPISEDTICCALHSMGFDKTQMTAHGFRTLASSLLNGLVFEGGKTFRPDAIERQLAHTERNKVRSIYNQADYFSERVEMMQVWADYLDSLIKK